MCRKACLVVGSEEIENSTGLRSDSERNCSILIIPNLKLKSLNKLAYTNYLLSRFDRPVESTGRQLQEYT
jgi:hypothetical protein